MTISFIDLNTHYELPMVEQRFGMSKEWLLDPANWKMDLASIELFNRARDGQGFSVIVSIEKDSSISKPIAKIILLPAYNQDDGLPKEDKNGVPYKTLEFVYSTAGFGQAGAGMVHQMSVKNYITRELFGDTDVKFSKEFEEKIGNLTIEKLGLTFGLGLIKGADRKSDYTITLQTNPLLANNLRVNYLNKIDIALTQYDPNKKYIILVPNNQKENSYEVYYILNQKIVRRPSFNKELVIPTITLSNNEIIELDKQSVIDTALKALNLFQPIYHTNKSASQNNASVAYDLDFESFTMYLDSKYRPDKTGRIIPEGAESGIHYDLQRSVPLGLMRAFCHGIAEGLREVKIDQEEIQNQKLKWSSFTEFNYEEVVKKYKKADPSEKLMMFANNIHITMRLYLETLRSFTQLSNENKQPFEYLLILQNRLDQLLFSFYKTQKLMQDTRKLFGNDEFIPACLKEVGDNRGLQQIFDDCHNVIQNSPRLKQLPLQAALKKMEAHLSDENLMRNNYIKEVKNSALALCTSPSKFLVTREFTAKKNTLLTLVRNLTSTNEDFSRYLQGLLRFEDPLSGKTALENAVQNEWYDVAFILLGYGADPYHHDQVTGETIMEIIFNKIKTTKDQHEIVALVSRLLYIFAERGDSEKVMALLLNSKNLQSEDLNQALIIAAEGRHLAIVKMILACDNPKANIYLKDKGHTLLYKAAYQGYVEIIEELFHFGEFSKEDINKAIQVAARKGHKEVVLLLLQKPGVNIDIQLLHFARMSGKQEIIQLIANALEQKTNVDEKISQFNSQTFSQFKLFETSSNKTSKMSQDMQNFHDDVLKFLHEKKPTGKTRDCAIALLGELLVEVHHPSDLDILKENDELLKGELGEIVTRNQSAFDSLMKRNSAKLG